MRKYAPDRPLFSIHLPKAAGTSFRDILQRWFKDRLSLHYFDETDGRRPLRHELKPGICIHGHFNKRRGAGVLDYYPEADQFITVMRDPLELHLSNYFYIKGNARRSYHFREGDRLDCPWKDVDDYLERTRSFLLDHFPWDLTPGNFRALFERFFIHIGLTENLQNSVDILAEKLGKERVLVKTENVSERDEAPSEALMRAWKEDHALEYAIYAYVKALNAREEGELLP